MELPKFIRTIVLNYPNERINAVAMLNSSIKFEWDHFEWSNLIYCIYTGQNNHNMQRELHKIINLYAKDTFMMTSENKIYIYENYKVTNSYDFKNKLFYHYENISSIKEITFSELSWKAIFVIFARILMERTNATYVIESSKYWEKFILDK